MTPATRELRALAARHQSALGDDVTAVAVTGSVGRGDASPASDLDLWAVVPKSRAPHELELDGVPVTCFYESPELLADLSFLATVEVEHAFVLRDDDGTFAHAVALARRKRDLLARAAVDSAQDRALRELFRARRCAPQARVVALRTAADALAVLPLVARGHRRPPRMREAADALGAAAGHAFARVQGAAAVDADALQARWATFEDAVLDARAALELPALPSRPSRVVARKLEHGEHGDALLAARRALARHVLTPARRAGHPPLLWARDAAPKSVRLLARAWLDADWEATRAAFADLLDALPLDEHGGLRDEARVLLKRVDRSA